MDGTFTVDEYRTLVRELYVTETMPLIKGYWLKLGTAIKQVMDEERFQPFDDANDEFEAVIFKVMNGGE